MFLPFFDNLRNAGIPVSLREYLTFLKAMSAGLVTYDIEGFYYLARTAMVKDERNIDRFDRAFAASFEGLEAITAEQVLVIDAEGEMQGVMSPETEWKSLLKPDLILLKSRHLTTPPATRRLQTGWPP